MSDGGWHFEPVPMLGGATADAFRNTLAGAGKDVAELLAREAIQNSWDARTDGQKNVVRVRIASRQLIGEALSAVRGQLGLLDSGPGPLDRPGLLSTDREQRKLGAELEGPLPVLVIEDFGTSGLGGTALGDMPQKEEDKYFRLCMELGGTEIQASGRGGTFGYGKSIYWAASRLWTVIFYSRFKPTTRTENATRRLIAVAWFRAHEFGDRRFTGRAWWGDQRLASGTSWPTPFLDDEADTRAEALGFRVRSAGQEGLSLMILGCDEPLQKLRNGIEQWWWPRLLQGGLEIELGGDVKQVAPRANPALARFVRAWDLLTGKSSETDDDKVDDIKYKGSPLGRYAITSVMGADAGDDEAVEIRVQNALVREPGMVVEYAEGPAIRAGHPPCAGVFRADAQLDQVLAKSEPPSHDKWDSRSSRSDRPLLDAERELIVELHKRVRKASSRFLSEHRAKPPAPPDRCTELERRLGRYLGVVKHAHQPPSHPPVPFHYRSCDGPRRVETAEGTVIDATVDVELVGDDAPSECLCTVSAWIDTLVENGRVGVTLPMASMQVRQRDGTIYVGVKNGGVSVIEGLYLSQGASARIDLRSDPLPHPEYTAELRLVTRMEKL